MNTKFGIKIGAAVIALLFIGLPQAKTNLAPQSFEVHSGGTLYLDSDSGSIKVDEVLGNIDARTSGGSISIKKN